jgi:glyoxylase-like metal-dependent hydrolase (beta-lactamase superfamily II)
LRSAGKTVLIETGVGDKERPLAQTLRPDGSLLDEMQRIGVSPDEIDIVINSHLHADHCGWNTRRNGESEWKPTFPRARYFIQRAEWDAATNPNERTRATYLAENMRPIEASGQLELIDGERAVTDDITIIPTFGHSMGHASIVLTSAGESAVYIGDMIQHPVQLERAAWVSSFDIYPLEAMETKKRVVERAINEQQLVIAVHADFPGLGRMTRTDDGKQKWTTVDANDA